MGTIAFLLTFVAYCFLAWLLCRLFDYMWQLHRTRQMMGVARTSFQVLP
jgi:hypothetical protein